MSFNTIKDIDSFCKKYTKLCSKNKKIVNEKRAKIYLKEAGYSNLKGEYDLYKIWKELDEVSAITMVFPGNKSYLNANDMFVRYSIFLHGSKELKKFIEQNGHTFDDFVNIAQIQRPSVVSIRRRSTLNYTPESPSLSRRSTLNYSSKSSESSIRRRSTLK
jgi:hypothetical protein